MRARDVDKVEAEMQTHESILRDIQRAKHAGNFRRDPSLKRFIPVHHVMFLDFKERVEMLSRNVNSRNHSKKKIQSILARAMALNSLWNIELRHYFN